MSAPAAENPWGLTPMQTAAMDALIKTGSTKGVAREMGLSPHTVITHLARVRERMGSPFRDHLQYILQWDRWRQSTKGAQA